MAKRSSLVAVGLMALALLAGCSHVPSRQATAPGDGAGTVGAVSPDPSSPGRTATALDAPAADSSPSRPTAAQASLSKLVQRYGLFTATSGVVNTPGGPLAIVARSSTVASPAVIEVLAFHSGHWASRGLFTSPLAVATDTPVATARLTGAPAPDFVVYTMGADFHAGSVISAVGGAWHMVPFSQRAVGTDVIAPNLKIRPGYVTSVANECKPSCATSTAYRTTNFSYNASAGAFIPLQAI